VSLSSNAVPESDSRPVHEGRTQIVELDVSTETLPAIPRHALAECLDGAEFLIRARAIWRRSGGKGRCWPTSASSPERGGQIHPGDSLKQMAFKVDPGGLSRGGG
jgi:hypothetical protein